MMVSLRLRDRPVVVLGGGPIAERRIAALLDEGARVAVVSPQVTAEIEQWAATGRIRLERRRYATGDLRGAWVAFAATGDAEANQVARAEADAQGIWLNVADEPSLCGFFMPAVVRRGRLTVGISTGGASPALAARLRQKLERDLGREYAAILDRLAALRARCREEGRPLADARDEIEALLANLLPREK
jgi:siroheme synthase-like protein